MDINAEEIKDFEQLLIKMAADLDLLKKRENYC